jgi:hypothetical protein
MKKKKKNKRQGKRPMAQATSPVPVNIFYTKLVEINHMRPIIRAATAARSRARVCDVKINN